MKVKLPDGTELELENGATGADAARAIGEGLARAALAVRVDGSLRDLTLEASRAELADVADSTDVQFVGVTLRNAGTVGASVTGGANVGFSYAHVYGTGGTGAGRVAVAADASHTATAPPETPSTMTRFTFMNLPAS